MTAPTTDQYGDVEPSSVAPLGRLGPATGNKSEEFGRALRAMVEAFAPLAVVLQATGRQLRQVFGPSTYPTGPLAYYPNRAAHARARRVATWQRRRDRRGGAR